jgi:methylated-DNA-[protein]-cysteine S-methyltransferase
MTMNYHYTYQSPVGPLHLVSDGEALIGLHFEAPQIQQSDRILNEPSVEPFQKTTEQLDQYFRGELRVFNLSIRFHGTDFQIRAWNALNEISYGETISYKAQANRIGSHPRAVGLANGQNPVAVIVPCHRVIGADGKLVGYGGGLSRKRALLQFEALVCDFGQQVMTTTA